MPRWSLMNNGPGRELSARKSIDDEKVYCVDCGNVFIWASGRHCPACHVDEKLDEVATDE